ncbi:uncharacterized protein HMPREF1541_03337 [Cyphellophora europaea CBS 101466]|uniref:CFEM domain-containing protein n=1 Tax=Cyphellophora europaea (strain CBS 101466) TaxID=1220924 RepID=W2RY99_CYPE1|nr:uncharacterized protein HMPREF1541_03337 [Cyphellophora europaea CBS 101466]ETN41402.1 hypothetical protein HMPREF1541_03337 [Cyphellophora europaea CBS 101466]
MRQQSRLRLLLAATLLTSATAQSTLPSQIGVAGPLATTAPSFPTCATDCLATATGGLPCEESDSRCLCSHQEDVRNSVTGCLVASNACTPEDTSKATSYYEDVCRALGLDKNGEPSLAISSGAIATAPGVIPTASSSSSSSTASPSAATTASSASNQGDDADKQEDNDDAGLSVATVAGIAAGCAFIVVAIITGLIWIYVKRRDADEEMAKEVESQSKNLGYDGASSSFKSFSKTDEKESEYVLAAIPPKSSERSQAPSKGRESKPTIAERRQRDNMPHKRSPSEALQTSTYPFPFGDKIRAEASVTSLTLPSSASKPVSAVIVQKSPTRSQYSDAASIYSVSSIHSEEAEVVQASEARRSRPTTFYNLYSGGNDGLSSTNLTEQHAVGRGMGSLRKNKFDLQVSTPPPAFPVSTSQPSPNPFTTPPNQGVKSNPFATPGIEESRNPFDSPPDTMSPQRRQNPVSDSGRSAILSGSSFGKFDFEIAEENQRSGRGKSKSLRDSFLNTLDLGLGKSTNPQNHRAP